MPVRMVKDRLNEFRQKSNASAEEMVEIMPSGSSIAMRDIQNMTEECRSEIASIEQWVKDIKMLHSKILSDPSADTNRSKEEVEDLMEKIKKSSGKLRNKLKSIDQQNQQDEKAHATKTPELALPAELRIRKNQHTSLCKRFMTAMTDYNQMQVEYREQCKKQIQRQLAITGRREVTDDQLEEMIESGNPGIFTDNIIVDTQKERQSLAEIQARHTDILKLEASIRELHAMFVDMSMLIEAQGEMVDRIEHNVLQSKDYVDTAAKNTKQALVYQKSARRRKVCIIGLVLLAIGIIVIIIVASVCTQQKC